jgi:site-specific recombinase XerD
VDGYQLGGQDRLRSLQTEIRLQAKDYEERTIAVSDTLLACLMKYRGKAPNDALIFLSPATQTVDKHLDRIINRLIEKANDAGYTVKKPTKPCHAFRVLYATRRYQQGVDIETLRQELGHSDITTTQIYLRSANTESARHRARINEADRFSLAVSCKPFRRRAVNGPAHKVAIACIQ